MTHSEIKGEIYQIYNQKANVDTTINKIRKAAMNL